MNNSKTSTTRAAVELFVLSAVSLYIELLIIRWMSADIRAFTVFRTFPLISCFVGMGLGFALGNDRSFKLFPLATLAFCLMMKACNMTPIGSMGFPSLSTFQWNNLVGLSSNSAYVVLFLLLMILILALPFGMCVAIGARLSVLFNEMKPLPAYSLNIWGAIAGSVIFQLASIFGLSPWQETLIPLAVVCFYLQFNRTQLSVFQKGFNYSTLILIPLAFIVLKELPAKPLIPGLLKYHVAVADTYWSPYQRLDLKVMETDSSPNSSTKNDTKTEGDKLIALELSANKAFYQYFFNTRPTSPIGNTELIESVRSEYALPCALKKPKSVLVVGAGTGQNVSAALEAGATDIDAVEIDPFIIEVGKRFNSDYFSDKVHLICDDARHFFNKSKKRYDVISFSALDSQTVSGLGSSVRIDTYVYTRESMAKALSLLTDDGLVVVSFATVAPWTKDRLFETFKAAAGYPPILLRGKFSDSIFILGPKVKDGTLQIPPSFKADTLSEGGNVRLLTDDWPYLYVQPNIVDYPYLLVVGEILLLAIYAVRRQLFRPNPPLNWQMFFLGAAFMLLELHAISFLSLLYGSTWMTSALVINGVLIMIFLANLLVMKTSDVIVSKQPLIYGCLFASIIASYFLSLDALLNSLGGDSPVAYAIATVVTILPMGIAGAIFASAFSTSKIPSETLAFNLFGAVIGGLLEYLSNYLGIRNLLLVSAGLYLASLLCHLRKRDVAVPESSGTTVPSEGS